MILSLFSFYVVLIVVDLRREENFMLKEQASEWSAEGGSCLSSEGR
jgi:hypothetical protein